MNIFAEALAEGDSKEQSDFFNQFCRALIVGCGDRLHMQVYHISETLDSNSRKIITDFAEMVKHLEESRPKTERELSQLRSEKYALEKEIAELIENKEKTK